MNKQKLFLEIEDIIGAGVINGEEVDVTTKKIVDKYWNILQYCDDKKDIINFGVWLCGHDSETIEKMYENWSKFTNK